MLKAACGVPLGDSERMFRHPTQASSLDTLGGDIRKLDLDQRLPVLATWGAAAPMNVAWRFSRLPNTAA